MTSSLIKITKRKYEIPKESTGMIPSDRSRLLIFIASITHPKRGAIMIENQSMAFLEYKIGSCSKPVVPTRLADSMERLFASFILDTFGIGMILADNEQAA